MYKLKNNGVTMISLVITIVILGVLAGISISQGSKIIDKTNLENLKTNMLLVKVKAKEFVENANFNLGLNFDSIEDYEKEERVEKAKKELVGEELLEGIASINITKEMIENDKENLIYYYKLSNEDLENIGLTELKLENYRRGYYIIKYDIKNVVIDVYNTIGFKYNDKNYYSLSEIEKIEIK